MDKLYEKDPSKFRRTLEDKSKDLLLTINVQDLELEGSQTIDFIWTHVYKYDSNLMYENCKVKQFCVILRWDHEVGDYIHLTSYPVWIRTFFLN